MRYPLLKKLKIKVSPAPIPHIKREELENKLRLAGISLDGFSGMFGIQTCYVDGPYPYDVEDCLQRLLNGKIQGTQLNWD